MSAQPSLEALLKNFDDGGWEALAAATDRNGFETSAREKRVKAVAENALWVAQQPQGREFLEWLFNQSIRRATWYGDLRVGMEQVSGYGLLREGQNSVAASILQALHHATGGDTAFLNQPEGAPDAKISRPLSRFVARARRAFRRRRR